MDDITTPALLDAPSPSPAHPAAPVPAPRDGDTAPLTVEQVRNVESLLDYVAEAGLDKDAALVTATLEALSAYRAAAGRDQAAALAAAKEVMRLYVQIGALTNASGITGRTIRSSAASMSHLTWMRLLGIGLVVAAVATDIAGNGAVAEPIRQLADHAIPMLWGSLGAIVFLLKTITDRASELTFDDRKMQGMPERILLGGLCGTILVNLFGAQGEGLTGAAVGFLAGLGTKAVYAAFETAVNTVAERVGARKTSA